MTIAAFSSTVKLGGHGVVVGLSSAGHPPGHRLVPGAAAERAALPDPGRVRGGPPAGRGVGVETALTIDLARRACGSPRLKSRWRTGPPAPTCAQLHRARQLADVARALATGDEPAAGPETRPDVWPGSSPTGASAACTVAVAARRDLGHGAALSRPAGPAAVGVRRCTCRPTWPSALTAAGLLAGTAGLALCCPPPGAAGGAGPAVAAGRAAGRGGPDAAPAVRLLGPAQLRRLRPDAGHRAQPVRHRAGRAGPAGRPGGPGRAGLDKTTPRTTARGHRRAGAGLAASAAPRPGSPCSCCHR